MSAQPTVARVLERAKVLGFLGPPPVSHHLEHSRRYLRLAAEGTREALDLGSGGGVPGLVLATEMPDTHWILLDAMERRVRFLDWARVELGLQNVDVVAGRAEELAHDPALRGRLDLVTARAFGPPPVVVECGAPFLRTGGRLIVSDPPGGTQRWPEEALADLGLRRRAVDEENMTVLEVLHPLADELPRRVGLPSKRPLFS